MLAAHASANDVGAITMPQFDVTVFEALLPDESTAWAVKLNVPYAVGVPVIAPVAGFNVKPAGSDPELIEYV